MTYPNLRAEMARKGVTCEQVANTAGVTPRTVSNWLNANTCPDMEQAKNIKRVLFPEHDLEYLFE